MKKLSEKARSLWGKKTVKNGQELWLPLVAHLTDTKNVINWLFNNWLSQGQRNLLAEELTEEKAQKLVNFLGGIHDIGKATPAFQIKESYVNNQELDQDLQEKLFESGFDLSHLILSNARNTPHALAGEALLEHWGLNKEVGAIIGGHHGKTQDDLLAVRRAISTYTPNFWQSDNDRNTQKKWQKVQQEIIMYMLHQCGYQSLKEIPSVNQPQAVLLEGLVIMADWLASSEYFNDNPTQPMFTLIPLDRALPDIQFRDRFERAICQWQQNDEWDANPEANIKKEYENYFNFDPHPIQQKMSQIIADSLDPGIIIIEAPMGMGKTEVALTAADQLAFKTGRTGLFFGLPTQATSNAMFSRVKEWLSNIAKSQKENFSIKLMTSKAQFVKEFTELPYAENVQTAGAVTINEWFSGKKSILNPFTIGTIDQLLMMGLKQRHLFLRHLGISGKIVIIDEIHAYDSYMSSYLVKVIEWLGAYHVPVIALSATLPKEKRKAFIEAYAKGKYGSKRIIKTEINWEKSEAYPLLTMLDGKDLKQTSNFPDTSKTQTVVKVIRLKATAPDLIATVQNKIKDGGVAGIIVNTVKRAQELAKLISEDFPKLILHSSFLAPDREKQEEELQSLIGKSGKRPDKLIVIGTQVLEQSLDIDFDVLFTDIAPMDLILQRIGRLHRHQIPRPKHLRQAQVYITGINASGDYGEANEYIYSKYLLMKTDFFLPDKITLPDDISPLVQAVYDERNNQQIEGIADVYSKFKNTQAKEKRKAKIFQISAPSLKRGEDLHGWLESSQLNIDKDELRAQAAVRDIKETVEVILLKRTADGIALLNGQIIHADGMEKSKKIAQQVIRLPAGITFNAEKVINDLENLTSKNFPEWQNNIWLRDAVGLVLDQDNNVDFEGWRLHYSSKFGLSYEKENENE